MAEKPAFPKVSLKYPSLEAFAKAARKCFEKGRLTVKLKRDFESGQKVLMVFTLGDRQNPVEIVGQVNDRVAAKTGEGYNYGIRFLNFSESKLNRLLAGEEAKPAPAAETPKEPEPAAEAQPQPPLQEPPAAPVQEPALAPEPEQPAPEPEPALTPEPEPAPPAEPEISAAPEAQPAPEIEQQPAPAPEPAPSEPVMEQTAPAAEEPVPLTEQSAEQAPEQIDEQSEPPGESIAESAIEGQPAETTAVPEQVEQLPTAATDQAQSASPEPASAETAQEEYGEFEFIDEEVTIMKGSSQDFDLRRHDKPPAPVAEQAWHTAPAQPPPDFESQIIEAPPATEVQPPTEAPVAMGPESQPEPIIEPAPEAPVEPPPDLSQEQAPEPQPEKPMPAAEPETPPEPIAVAAPEPEPIPEAAPEPEPKAAAPSQEQPAEPDLAPPPGPTPEPAPQAAASEQEQPVTPAPLTTQEISAPAAKEIKPPPPDEEFPELLPETSPEAAPAALGREIVEINKPVAEEKPVPASEPAAEAPAPAPELKPISPKEFSEFLFRFCKMIMNPPDPKLPESGKSFNSLFEEFQAVISSRDRIGIYLAIAPGSKDFIIEGAAPAARSIRVILPPDLSGTLIFKMIELFDRKGLVGIIFRKFIDLERFQNFILNLGNFDPEKENGDALALRLIYLGVFHFNLIFETDLVPVPEKIEEETKIILARFYGELKRLNSLAGQMSEEPLALLTLRMEDIVKFVNNPVVVVQMLEHLPLVWAGQVEEFEFQDFEDQILFSVPVKLLLGTFEIFARRIRDLEKQKLGKDRKKEAMRQRLEKLMKRVMARIAYEAPAQALEPLSQLFERKVIRYEELPLEIRDQVAASSMAKEFLKKPESELEKFEALREFKAYNERAGQLLWSAVAMLEEGKLNWAQQIFSKLVDHYQEKDPPFAERSKAAREVLRKLAEPTAVEIAVRYLSTGRKEEKELAASMLYAAGPDAARRLLNLLETSEDRNVRRMISEVLARMGERVSGLLLEEINKPDIPWYLFRNLLMVFSEIKSPIAQERGKLLAQHAHRRVREEALGYLFAIKVEGLEQLLLDALKDPEVSVRTRGLGCLAKQDQLSDQALDRVYQLTRQLTQNAAEPEAELCFQQAIELLDKAGAARKFDGMEIDKFFLSMLEQAEKGLFSRAKLELSPKMKLPLVEALGRRKSGKAQKVIGKLAKDKDEQLKKAAQKALEQIGQ
jgi:hypothetical protein